MGARHFTRQLALQALYALDANPVLTANEAIGAVLLEAEGDERAPDGERLEELVRGTWAKAKELDPMVEKASKNWKLSRMDRVDRSILRLGAYELCVMGDVPAPVVLSEAVELAKEFGSPDSPAFINGILDRVARECRPEEVRKD